MSFNKIILINQSSGYLTVDIANALAEKYDEVLLLCGSLNLMNKELSDKVKPAHLICYNRKSGLSRLFTWLYGTIQIFFKLLFVYRQHEIVYVTNPPMSYIPSLILRRRFSIIVYDIYPDALKNIGIGENHFIYKLWRVCNKKIFASAYRIFTLSEGMKKCLSQYASADKIYTIPNWSHLSDINIVKKEDNPFIKKMRLEGQFVVLYSGNIGYTHDLEIVIEAARLLSVDSEIRFLFIGDGAKKIKLQQMTKEYDLNNCLFLDWQPGDLLINSLSSADISVVTLNDATAMLSVPSKTYNLLAVGAPILAIANKNSELNKLIAYYKCGSCFDGNELEKVVDYITFLKQNRIQKDEISCNAKIASSDFTMKNAQKYADLLTE